MGAGHDATLGWLAKSALPVSAVYCSSPELHVDQSLGHHVTADGHLCTLRSVLEGVRLSAPEHATHNNNAAGMLQPSKM
jgi:hypothetical protein